MKKSNEICGEEKKWKISLAFLGSFKMHIKRFLESCYSIYTVQEEKS